MVALCIRADHYIFILSFVLLLLLSFYLFSSPNFGRRRVDVCHTSCEFKMQVWNVLHADRWKYRTQKSRQKWPLGHHRTTLSGYIRHVWTVGKKLVKQQYVLHMSPQYGELRPTSGWDRCGSLRHLCKFQRVSRLRSVTAHSSSK